MSRIKFDELIDREYETGVSQGVLYVVDDNGDYSNGVAWNGLTQVQEKPTGAEETALYADDIKYLSLFSKEQLEATVECYTYPDEWKECDGSKVATNGVIVGQQGRKMFGMCYKTIVGNAIKGDDYGYKLHLLYGAKASPSERGYETVGDSPNAIKFSYSIKTTPVAVEKTGFKPTALITIDSTDADPTNLKKLEDILLGTDGESGSAGTNPRLPLPDEVFGIMDGTINP